MAGLGGLRDGTRDQLIAHVVAPVRRTAHRFLMPAI
jgi:hypothetical protein